MPPDPSRVYMWYLIFSLKIAPPLRQLDNGIANESGLSLEPNIGNIGRFGQSFNNSIFCQLLLSTNI